ncbi:UNVERIFIED_ORG: outer membrane immunogenic protein [Martelella mediterranea]
MRKIFTCLVVAYGATCLPASAADLILRPSLQPAPYRQAPAAAAYWTGPYAGVEGGFSWSDARGTLSGLGSDDTDFDGANATLFAGYNRQMGNIVVGLEGDASYSWGKRSFPTGLGFDYDLGSDWSGSLRGRLGYSAGNALFYVTGGAAVANVYARTHNVSISDTLFGYTVGAGLDYAFTDNVFGRLEYRYTGYPDQDAVDDLASLAGVDAKIKMHNHAVKAGIGVKF